MRDVTSDVSVPYLQAHFSNLWTQRVLKRVRAGANYSHTGGPVWQIGRHLHSCCVSGKTLQLFAGWLLVFGEKLHGPQWKHMNTLRLKSFKNVCNLWRRFQLQQRCGPDRKCESLWRPHGSAVTLLPSGPNQDSWDTALCEQKQN